jgi:hypothetical protein
MSIHNIQAAFLKFCEEAENGVDKKIYQTSNRVENVPIAKEYAL